MSNTPRNLTRNQLAEFLPNARAVRAFEQLLEQVSTLLPSDIATINRLIQETYIEATSGTVKAQTALDLLDGNKRDAAVNAGAADAKATAALDALNSIAKSLDLLAKAPPARADNSLTTDYLDFSAVPKYSAKPGRLHWGSTGTLEIEMGGGNITQQVGEEFFVYGKATAAITEGQLIMITGAVGASGAITFEPSATGIIDPNAILGIATENIPLNGFGRVTTMGVVHGINTTGASVGEVWADGDVLWYNTAFVGSMTKVKPVAPNMKTQVAIVINAGSGGSGSLQVEINHGSTLGGTDSNVQMSALVDKQLLQYDAAAGYWKNVSYTVITVGKASNLTGGLAGSLPYQTAVDATSMLGIGTAGQVLQVNAGATAPQWVSSNGTGNIVRTTSPSLVTPALGDATATSLKVNYVVGLKIDNAGTMLGQLYYSGALLLDRAAGTTFKVQQAGADQVVVTTAGDVQIGSTTGSTYRLFIYKADNTYATLYVRQDGTADIAQFTGSGGSLKAGVTAAGNVYAGPGFTTMTDGFFYVPAAAGAPTAAPTAIADRVPMYYDKTNNKFYVYNGAWKSVTLT